MIDDTRLISNVVSLLKLTTSEHGIYKPSIYSYKEKNIIAQLLCRKILTIVVMLYNS